jgi:uncharacterized protein
VSRNSGTPTDNAPAGAVYDRALFRKPTKGARSQTAPAVHTRHVVSLLFLSLCLLLPLVLLAQDVPIPPAPTQWVTDTAAFLSPEDAERINARLRTYEEQTHHQLLVWIGPTTGNDSIEDWANRAFEQWKVGRKGIDDGLILFIMPKDRRLRIEVGYGLEGEVPDLLANRIIQGTIVPRIRAGDNAGAVEAGLEAIATAIGEPLPGVSRSAQRDVEPEATPLSLGRVIFYGIVVLVILGILGTNPSLATWLLISLLSGGNRRGRRGGGWGGGSWGGGGWSGGGGGWSGGGGGWGGGGGGFSGGGGMSGGGGASGSW